MARVANRKRMRIRHLGDPVLRRKARRVERITPAILETIDSMWETMYDNDGVGLAAPQVGVSQRIIVVDTQEENQKFALINPEIIFVSDEITPLREGCLSIPDLQGEVFRPAQVKLRAQVPNGLMIEVEADGLLAKCFQHEIDHLNGILFIDHVSEDEFRELHPELTKFQPDIAFPTRQIL